MSEGDFSVLSGSDRRGVDRNKLSIRMRYAQQSQERASQFDYPETPYDRVEESGGGMVANCINSDTSQSSEEIAH